MLLLLAIAAASTPAQRLLVAYVGQRSDVTLSRRQRHVRASWCVRRASERDSFMAMRRLDARCDSRGVALLSGASYAVVGRVAGAGVGAGAGSRALVSAPLRCE